MFHHHKSSKEVAIVTPPEETVRLLHSPKELQAAIERAREFERRGIDEYQRRVGTYDRFLDGVDNDGVHVAPIDPSASHDD